MARNHSTQLRLDTVLDVATTKVIDALIASPDGEEEAAVRRTKLTAEQPCRTRVEEWRAR